MTRRLADDCRARLTHGYAKLDPSLRTRKLITAWRLWVPEAWKASGLMIDKREILEAASSFSLLPNVVEKDYVLGWILAGINAHEELAESWVFKGGTCLKKCYFETYRFSEDLDFTLRDESHLDEEFLKPVFEEVVAWVTEQSGLNIAADQLEFDIYDNPRGKPNCQGKIAYRGPVSPTSGGWPKIKLDLTADERLVLPSVRREVFHPYSDKPEGGIWANCYAYEEAFGEKLRALGERTRPRDLYDVVNLYRHTDSRPTAYGAAGRAPAEMRLQGNPGAHFRIAAAPSPGA